MIECGEAISIKIIVMEKKWFAVYTRSRCEKKVAQLLTKRGFVNYCPLNKKLRQWSDRKKYIFEPLFPSYVFVYIEESELTIVKRLTDCIINPVFWLGRPAQIKEAEIEAIRDFIGEFGSIKIIKQKVNVNDKVRIVRGPFNNYEASVSGFKNNMISVLLPSLGYMMLSEINQADVELISPVTNESEYVHHSSIAI